MKKYQPSNGTEGEIFIEKHCMNCVHCDADPDGDKQCEILLSTMVFDVNDRKYPKQWVYVDNVPTCTKWKKPDDGEEEEIIDPNQMKLF